MCFNQARTKNCQLVATIHLRQAKFVTTGNTSSIPESFRIKMEGQKIKKSHKCDLCEFAFTRAENFKTHLKIHSGEKSYKCNMCDYASVHPSKLKIHLKIHSGEKSHKCNLCDYASVRADGLRNHLKKHATELEVVQMRPMWLCIC